MSFFDKYKQITKKHNSYVCIGLDTDPQKIPTCLKGNVLTFNKKIIDETYKYCAAYKPNFAFYLSQGAEGVEILRKTIEHIPKDTLIILDIKAGDIGNTMQHYASFAFEYLKIDAMTINTLMGSDVIEACLGYDNSFAFALVLTSNDSASDFFKNIPITEGERRKAGQLYEKIALQVKNTGYEKLGAVVGATQIEDIATIRPLMPETILLVPGIGSQGGDLTQVCKHLKYSNEDARFLINSSRGIIFADNTENFATVAKNETIKLKENINKEIPH